MTDQLKAVPYINDILRQPEALQNTLSALAKQNMQDLTTLVSDFRSGKQNRIILTGMGSSFHALRPLLLALLQQSIPAILLETSELIHYSPALLSEDSLIVAVSQSGASVEIKYLLKQLPPKGKLIGVTNTPGSPLTERSDVLLLTQAGPENSVSCKTYITALAALAVIQAELTGLDVQAVLTKLAPLSEAILGYLSNLENYVSSLESRLQDINHVILAGRGVSMAAALTGGLIIKEAAHFPAEGMSCAAFRHGPQEMISERIFIMVYEGLDPTRAINRNLVDDIRKNGGRAALVETSQGRDVFHLPAVPAIGLPIVEILPAQILSVALAKLNDHTPGQFSMSSKITSVE